LKKGFVLFAEPTVQHDLTFSRSVILIVEQNENGIVGFIINKKTDYSTIDLIPELNINFPIYNGGPVEKENLYFIHKIPSLIKNSIKIKDNLYWGGNFDLVVELINENKIKNNEIKFFLGYSGWEKEQLNNEIQDKSWILAKKENLEKLAFQETISIWKDKLKKIGEKYLLWINSPENPQHN
jgi:putative transcriptional regulator